MPRWPKSNLPIMCKLCEHVFGGSAFYCPKPIRNVHNACTPIRKTAARAEPPEEPQP